MEPQAESISISDKYSNISIKQIYDNLEVKIPELVKYCPYTGSYEDMIEKAKKENNINVLNDLIQYKNDMIDRDNKIKQLNRLLK